ncbi:hypothetical protein B0T24DRAFT_196934 [Lasiosphaeria ovina]|uniref:MFS general substrate transporter n=1 Tax=Lasiosphaeria ovina TaxID=92902 RepID=A0AAE0TUY1_9PEZI|nr:hypothetical protein B0T24DRAFT_196934 [Lasiosphaeria ovina]
MDQHEGSPAAVAPPTPPPPAPDPEKCQKLSLWVQMISMAWVCFFGVFAQAPFVRIYGSVLCCEHVRGRGGCLFGGLEDESLCRHVPAVQARLMEINAGLVFWGGFGLISALFWVPVWRRVGVQKGLFWARFSSVLGEVVQAAIAFTNGRIPLGVIVWLSPLVSSLSGGGGITFMVLTTTAAAGQTNPGSSRSNAILLLDALLPSLAGISANMIVGWCMATLGPWKCLWLGLVFTILGTLLLLPQAWHSKHSSPNTQMCICAATIDVFKSGYSLLISIFQLEGHRTLIPHNQRRLAIFVLLPSLFSNAMSFSISTLSRLFIPPRFDLSVGDASRILGCTEIPTFVILFITTFATLLKPVPQSVSPHLPARESSSTDMKRDLVKVALCLLAGLIGNVLLASATTVTMFEVGLVAVFPSVWYTCFTRSVLTTIGKAESATMDLLLLDQVLEAIGRVVFVKVIDYLFRLGLEYQWALSSPYWGVSIMCLLALGSIICALFALGDQAADEGLVESSETNNDTDPTESSPLIVRDQED